MGEGSHDGPNGCSNVAMLAGEVTGLASLGRHGFTSVQLSAGGGIEMGHGGRAVAIGGDGELVDVVHCDAMVFSREYHGLTQRNMERTEGAVGGYGGETSEVHREYDTGAIRICGSGNGACDRRASGIVKIRRGKQGAVGRCWKTALNRRVTTRTCVDGQPGVLCSRRNARERPVYPMTGGPS